MKYYHRFRVRTPLSQVAEFHSRASSMAAITPPPILVKMHTAPANLADGDQMDFTMWLGPLPVRWLARIEAVTPAGFTDRQLKGPFAEWAHRHSFSAVDEQTTDVIDEVTIRLRPHLFWGPVGLGMLLGLPVLFAFRGWKTRRMLQ
jgi:ligand-binding SRPBCC domain-containing protein